MHNQTISIIMLLNSTLYQCHMLQNLTHQLYYHDLRMNPHKMSTLFSLKLDIMMLILKYFGYHVCLLWDKCRAEVSYCIMFNILRNFLQQLPRFVSLFREATNEKGGINLCLLEYYWNETLFLYLKDASVSCVICPSVNLLPNWLDLNTTSTFQQYQKHAPISLKF